MSRGDPPAVEPYHQPHTPNSMANQSSGPVAIGSGYPGYGNYEFSDIQIDQNGGTPVKSTPKKFQNPQIQ